MRQERQASDKGLNAQAAGMDDRHPDFIVGLAKGLRVIECFDDEHESLTISQAAALAGLSRASARRCLLTLTRLGYVTEQEGRFRLGARTLGLGTAYLLATPLPQLVQPFLEHLGERLEESCSVSILEGADIVYVARSARRRIVSVGLGVGTRLPAYCTSMGRVLLAALALEEARAHLERSERRMVTPHTQTHIAALLSILENVRRQGYCINDQELEIGLVSIAVPLIDGRGRTVAALNVGAQAQRVSAAMVAERFLPPLLETQRSLRPLLK